METKTSKQAVVISIANHKGGVGKTTTAVNVGEILYSLGYSVLLVDIDMQANLTQSVMDSTTVKETVYDAMTASGNMQLPLYPLRQYDVGEELPGSLYVVPSSLELARADLELAGVMARESILDGLLESVRKDFDYILVDCPPSLGLMTLNAITASDYVIIPLSAEVLPFIGLTMMDEFISSVHNKLNPKVKTLGVLITRYEKTNLSRDIENGLRERLGGKVFKTKIRKNVSLAQAPLARTGIVTYDPKSNGATDYKALTSEIIDRVEYNRRYGKED